jgi:hypothetical protein
MKAVKDMLTLLTHAMNREGITLRRIHNMDGPASIYRSYCIQCIEPWIQHRTRRTHP